jgi:DeoR family transcriptional regulator, fructose operon transcriptional repressor
MNLDTRRKRILEYITSHGFATAEELAKIIQVSEITIRRDLTRMEADHFIRRVHGGAVPRDQGVAVTHINARMRKQINEKRAIAQLASQLADLKETVFLDAGSTCAYVAEALPEDKDLTVITHSLPNLMALKHKHGIQVIGIGGQLDRSLDAFVGPLAEAELETFSVDRAFLGTAGIDPDYGCINNSLAEKRIKNLMNQQARHCYILADGSKFGQPGLHRTIPIATVRNVITDAAAPAEQVRLLR